MLQMKIKMQDFPVGKCRLAYTFAKYCHSEMGQKRRLLYLLVNHN